MRTTLDIEEDLLAATQEIARREHTSAGRVVSRLLRQALTHQLPPAEASATSGSITGFRAFASRGVPVTNAEIDRLRDAEGL